MPSARPQAVAAQAVAVRDHLLRAKALQTAPFTYDLPESRIATRPLPTRHDSKLLVVPRLSSSPSSAHGRPPPPRDMHFSDLPRLLPPNALIVRNTTRVIPARLPLFKRSGARAEVLLLEPCVEAAASFGKEGVHELQPGCTGSLSTAAAMEAPADGQTWHALLGGRRIRVGDVLTSQNNAPPSTSTLHPDSSPTLDVIVEQKGTPATSSTPIVRLNVNPSDTPLRTLLQRKGHAPLPPYMRRAADTSDTTSFQTVFAQQDGSVAAPTAALHMTQQVLAALEGRGVQVADVVLHIGAATFRPVVAECAGGHDMHHEGLSVSGAVVQRIAHQIIEGRPVVALGTTSMRTIESLYWFGVRLLTSPCTKAQQQHDILSVSQWEPYEQLDSLSPDRLPPPADALQAILDWCGGPDGCVHGGTNLLILPGYPCMIHHFTTAVTNFHQPMSTLLMLVSAFYGGQPGDLKAVYDHALTNNYRFLSYGDSSIYADADFFET